MKKANLILAIGFIAASTMFTSCTKDNTTPKSSTFAIDAQDNSVASAAFEDVDDEVDNALGVGLKSGDDDSLPSITTKYWKRGEFKKELSFNNINRKGKVRSGKIIVTVTYPVLGDTLDTTKWVKTITFENYKVGDRLIEGTKTITYLGIVDGYPQWNITLVGGKVTFANGKFITHEFERTRKMIEGSDTPLIHADDVFEINGTGSGINRRGLAYTTITTSLIKEADCPFFKSGTVIYESEEKIITIVYTGGDACEASATITVDGKTETIDTDAA
jgi:hypothetical protein